jgi:DNA (cytosine-5)-methyltransferase 1
VTHLSLFSGIGGLDLAAEWAGFTTVGQCEWADYPTKVLEKHWPDVPRWRDIRDLSADDFRRRTGIDRPTIISGGFPCQPFSVAGKQKGKGDDRYLWPEMLRVIRELAPRWVVGENVPGILRIAADDVCADLERLGYEVGIFDFEAAAVGAPHRRERIAFVASQKQSMAGNAYGKYDGAVKRVEGWSAYANRVCEVVAYANQSNGQARGADRLGNGEQAGASSCAGWWTTEPDVGRVAHGVPARVDRLKCLGNAVVPQQFYPIFKAMAEVKMEQSQERTCPTCAHHLGAEQCRINAEGECREGGGYELWEPRK